MDESRREFLAKCGKFVVVTPVAMTAMMTASVDKPALAQSGSKTSSSRRSRSRSSGGNFSLFDLLARLF